MHYGERISTIVSPKDCSTCHSKEVSEFEASHHAQGGKILGSLDNVLAEVVEGTRALKTPAFPMGVSAAAVNGCWQCHGSEVKVLDEGKLDPATWPNTGIGRLNPDGSRGACSACHSRHSFSVEQARNPENCGKCHMGPDHPQLEGLPQDVAIDIGTELNAVIVGLLIDLIATGDVDRLTRTQARLSRELDARVASMVESRAEEVTP